MKKKVSIYALNALGSPNIKMIKNLFSFIRSLKIVCWHS